MAETGERVVPDPLQPGAVLKARVSLEHPIDMMFARGRLTPAQYEAAVRFRALYERAQIGAARGVDFARLRVDGGAGAPDALTQSVVDAHKELHRIARVLTMVGYRVAEVVIGRGVGVSSLAAMWPNEQQAERARCDYLMGRLLEVLDTLGTQVWGATGPARGVVVGDAPRAGATAFVAGVQQQDDPAQASVIDGWLKRQNRRKAQQGA